MENMTYKNLKELFPGKHRICQSELKKAGIGSESTIIRRKNANDLHLLPKFKQEGRRIMFRLEDVADFIDGKSTAADVAEQE